MFKDIDLLAWRMYRLVVRHRRPLFGIAWLPVSIGFGLGYLGLVWGLLAGHFGIAAAAAGFSMFVEATDILPESRRSRRLSNWRRGLEIRSNWRAFLVIGALGSSSSPTVLIILLVATAVGANVGVRLVRLKQMGLSIASRVRPLGSLLAGKDRLTQAEHLVRRRDLSELVLEAAVPSIAVAFAITGFDVLGSVAISLVVVLVIVGYLGSIVVRIRRMRRLMLLDHDDEVLRAFVETDPEVLCYFNGHQGSQYAVDVWLKVFENCDRRVGLVFRSDSVKSVNTQELPGVVVRPDAMVERVVSPATRIALYPANGTKNIHLQRDPRLKHVFIGHGDSDKAGSASPFTKSYDSIWVSGTAAIDRYRDAGISIPQERFEIVGRPQLSKRLREPPNQSDVEHFHNRVSAVSDRAGKPAKVILYAPTWEGYFEEADYSSIFFGQDLIDRLTASHEQFVVVFRPHPMTGHRLSEASEAAAEIEEKLLEQNPDRWDYASLTLYDWFGLTDLLISDISSVATDFMNWHKPLAIPNLRFDSAESMRESHPSTRTAYVLPPDVDDSVKIVEEAVYEDPMRGVRAAIEEEYLGPLNRDPLELFGDALDRLYRMDSSA